MKYVKITNTFSDTPTTTLNQEIMSKIVSRKGFRHSLAPFKGYRKVFHIEYSVDVIAGGTLTKQYRNLQFYSECERENLVLSLVGNALRKQYKDKGVNLQYKCVSSFTKEQDEATYELLELVLTDNKNL